MCNKKIVMYIDSDGNERRDIVYNKEIIQYIQECFSFVEVFSVEDCIRYGIGFPEGDDIR